MSLAKRELLSGLLKDITHCLKLPVSKFWFLSFSSVFQTRDGGIVSWYENKKNIFQPVRLMNRWQKSIREKTFKLVLQSSKEFLRSASVPSHK